MVFLENMKITLLITLWCVFLVGDRVLAAGENEIKRGAFPYMAFLYYLDESVIEPSGARFIRGAVLVKPDWLITSSVGPMTINEVPLGFPRKTLLARLGAVTINSKFTLNEDEEEQEREVIQIVRPFNHSATQWWRTDITLLKILMPFTLTPTVNVGSLHETPNINLTKCFILIYTRPTENLNEDRQLMQLFVDMVRPGSQDCGAHYHNDTMLCAVDNLEFRASLNNSEFCQNKTAYFVIFGRLFSYEYPNETENHVTYRGQKFPVRGKTIVWENLSKARPVVNWSKGNSGGPLVCEKYIVGIQTYIENKCDQPHLYQDLLAWEDFITCGIEDKCNEEQCSNMCVVLNKDDEATTLNTRTTEDQPLTSETITLFTLTEEITVHKGTEEMLIDDDQDEITPTISTTTSTTQKIVEELTTTTTTSKSSVVTPTMTTSEPTKGHSEESSWPKEKYPHRESTKELESKGVELKANVEAQRQNVKKVRGAAGRNACLVQSLFSVCILACLI